ncbi:P-loop containing nucleoside triphosphate hydrolase protein [Hygrophoropsis aurantiaca]|uniref:P-loop containing nucleoside triphosphate hydrolase protein n=1 Tax=Hygrophoropsis aurantiaca TaxID=72124 RepID=A0ACB8A5I7_9AGAM|nr:P-loop containing nucleoside triphosphate hydrolase protein [Hygrophoropsis aurantiaca]
MDRTRKLNNLFYDIIKGKASLAPRNASLFLEATLAQDDPVACIGKIMDSPSGIQSVQTAMRLTLTIDFLNGVGSDIIAYLLRTKDTGSGDVLGQVLDKIVDPPVFWDAFIAAFCAGQLVEKAQIAFVNLLLHLLTTTIGKADKYREVAGKPTVRNAIESSAILDIRNIGYRITHILAAYGPGALPDTEDHPGGRHDNDFSDFRQIAILPTADEILSEQSSFLRSSSQLEDPNTEKTRIADYLDNTYRLLREDMIHEMREELQIALKKKKGKHRGLVIDGLKLIDIHCGTPDKRCRWAIVLQCHQDIWPFKNVKDKDRLTFLKNDHHGTKVLKHQSLACIIVGEEVAAFATVNRVEDMLAKKPPIIVLHLEGEAATTRALLRLHSGQKIKLIQIDTAIFAYEPVLKAIQNTQEVPLSEEILFWKKGDTLLEPSSTASRIIQSITQNPSQDLQSLLGTSTSIKLDESQAASLLSGLSQRVSLVQGPPGTGKSFIGALLAKALHDCTVQTILVVCYTNHALDQFLEDLIKIGIPSDSMVRLGAKAKPELDHLSLFNCKRGAFKRTRGDYVIIDDLKSESESLCDTLEETFTKYHKLNIKPKDILQHLEFHPEDAAYFDAFLVPSADDGMTIVDRKGNPIDDHYLYYNWSNGWNAAIFKDHPSLQASQQIWNMTKPQRLEMIGKWTMEISKELVSEVTRIGKEYNERQVRLARKFTEHVIATLKTKRIIACTTTGAAKYSEDIREVAPQVLLVEEAGEILESHILTALGRKTEQLILIGDHKQLRPKVNHYLLTLEKGEGYDLNVSLFERLVKKGFPHKTLTAQHRMRPEISALVRHLTYKDLSDAPGTQGRDNIRGLRDNIIFVSHDYQEDEMKDISDRADGGASSSKQNTYEVQMVLKIVRYLGQQGYGTDKLVVLTPYLGQLYNLREALKTDTDPVLNDLDSYDLVRAGLLTAAAANVSKKRLRLATIDNYQGEESHIVIASLTRSNASHDIGFMSSPERVNVLLSRARDGLILVGNVPTFLNARKGQGLWTDLLGLLKKNGHVYDGLPVKCERHPTRQALLKEAVEFDEQCPDGGCTEPCGTMLSCNLHRCPSRCHQLYDHSKMPCGHILYSKCLGNIHDLTWQCHQGPPATCSKCDREAARAAKEQAKAFKLQQQRDADRLAHERRMADIEAQYAQENESAADARLAKQRADAIRQKLKDLEDLKAQNQKAANSSQNSNSVPFSPPPSVASMPQSSGPAPPIPTSNQSATPPPSQPPPPPPKPDARTSTQPATSPPSQPPPPPLKSEAGEDWQRQKDIEGARNDALDKIMDMTGLEDVKNQVLRIKAKIDLAARQGLSLDKERLNLALLGNPGTGKTTVARLYGQFLASIQVLPGKAFIETTGSNLANDGVTGAKKLIDDAIKAGGGAIFIDEAYQLVGEHQFQGGQVLDFLLAEMENRVGTLVFILAGYNKQMEKFFEHNPGIPSRVPYRMQFSDYEDVELLGMLEDLLQKRYKGAMNVEDGIRGLYGRIAVRRLGYGRGKEGFGNARALQNMFAKICERQAERVKRERKEGRLPDDFFLAKEDLIGPDPSTVIPDSKPWAKLQELTGLETVKESIRNLFALIEVNYQRELREQKPIEMTLNRVFLGSPGTGKTTVAKLYGQVLSDLGLLSNGEVVVKNPADFVGAHLGASEKNTKAILASTVGKVLVIDEAYMLYAGSGQQDPYKTAVIDTIVAEIQSVPGEDRCVLLLGYKPEMEAMFQNVNPGLSRRFAIENAFSFEDFTQEQLREILEYKLQDQNLAATDTAKDVACNLLDRLRARKNFGNAGEVENVLGQAKNRYQKRQASLPAHKRSDVVFEPRDFDPDYDRDINASSNLTKLFEDIVGCEEIISKLGDYQKTARGMKAQGMDMRQGGIPTNFVFKGPPGTGKTTVARKMGKVYYDMGFLSNAEVVECSASDLVGQYVGQTGPKTKKLFEKALGKVLFVDEAYRLGEGHFAKEAMDELVGLLTHPDFKGKLLVVLAGYDQEMNGLLAVNPGLSSRFSEEVVFSNISPDQCLAIIGKELTSKNVSLDDMDLPSSDVYLEMKTIIEELSQLPSWGNARDAKTMATTMINEALKSAADKPAGAKMTLTATQALNIMQAMLSQQRSRVENVPKKSLQHEAQQMAAPQQQQPPPPLKISQPQIASSSRTRQPLRPRAAPPPAKAQTARSDISSRSTTPSRPASATQNGVTSVRRDAGVSDAVWNQLQVDKQAAELAAAQAKEAQRKLQQELQRQEARQKEAERAAQKLAQARAKDQAEQDELKRKREAARIKEVEAKAARDRAAAALRAKQQEEQRLRAQEAQVQTKLRQMGVCVAGFQWIKQASGYRCAGGSHFISNAQLGI